MNDYRLTKADILAAKEVDIVEYLTKNGFVFKPQGGIYWCSSPFASDTEPSFAVYPTKNRFKDFSAGSYGDVIELARGLHNLSFRDAVKHILEDSYIKWDKKKYKDIDYDKKEFKKETYINRNKNEKELIHKYAQSRGITEGYETGVFFKKVDEEWLRIPCLMFLHQDEDMNITGAKFRNIDRDDPERFSARGRLGFYILENKVADSFESQKLYLVESETSANSLYMYFKQIRHNATVISYGGVAAVPEKIPFDLPLRIIIDFDGNEELYKERLKHYSHLGGTSIKMQLPKGEDLNSLWAKNKINVVNNLLFNE
jgi:hypothetical protein